VHSNGIALTAAIAALCALAGILAQPLARWLDLRPGRNRAAAAGLLVLAAELVLARSLMVQSDIGTVRMHVVVTHWQ
jgi:hypothetical protein